MNDELLDFFLKHWGVINLEPFGRYLRDGSSTDLRSLIERVRLHGKEHGERLYLNVGVSDSRLRSSHAAAKTAIRWELLKRSKIRLCIYNAAFPPRAWWAGFWAGRDMVRSESYGHLFRERKRGRTLFHIYGLKLWAWRLLIRPTLSYMARNVYWIVPTIVGAVVAIYWAR